MTGVPFTEDQMVSVNLNGIDLQMPKGANLVDAAKWYVDEDIPVFCYHPKLDPVGMCRMCVVEIGAVARDRATGEVQMDDDGNPQIRWLPKLQTACTQTITDGMHIRTNTEAVEMARESVIEFLLTSHPLDCPICDKGGECPLQNLTMEHGNGESRMQYGDKMHLAKHVPLGDLIYLDRERCIQCGRCVRFQDELVGDDVLAFHERGRRLQIITKSDPGFDTYFSGNTTDICPVGALTTTDFRFGARPWELTNIPSISPHDATGANLNLSTRMDRDFGGRTVVKRVMPRQNELVNEMWISDRDRFVHHFARDDNRLMRPQIRRGNKLQEATWDDALATAARLIVDADGDVAAIAGGAVTNEDLWELRRLVTRSGSERLGAWPYHVAGAEEVAAHGFGGDASIMNLGAGDAILVIATDLEEEAPLWRLQVKQAQDRGAYLAVANVRPTRMEEFAVEGERHLKPVAGGALRYLPGQAAQALDTLKDNDEIYSALSSADNLLIIFGAEGLDFAGSKTLAQSAVSLLQVTGNAGKPHSGLLSTLPGPNGMGLYYMGYMSRATQDIMANPPRVLLVAQAHIAEDDPDVDAWLSQVEHVITFSLFPERTTAYAEVALPIQSFTERDGTFTNGLRRVQRFYTAQGPMGKALPLWEAAGRIGEKMGHGRLKMSAAAVMLDITRNVAAFEGMRYKDLGQIVRQFPDVGGDDLYYGGTAYRNLGGIGQTIERGAQPAGGIGDASLPQATDLQRGENDFFIVPTERMYNRSVVQLPSVELLLSQRVDMPYAEMNTADADRLDLRAGDSIEVDFGSGRTTVEVRLSAGIPEGVLALPRHLNVAAVTPMVPTVGSVQRARIAEPVLA